MVRAVALAALVLVLGGAAVAQAQPADSTFPCSGVATVPAGSAGTAVSNANCAGSGWQIVATVDALHPQNGLWVEAAAFQAHGATIHIHLNTKAEFATQVAYIGFTTTPTG